MSIQVDPYVVARDAIRQLETMEQIHQLREELRVRHNQIVARHRMTLRLGDRVRYIGTSYAAGLVPGLSVGTVIKIGPKNVVVKIDGSRYSSVRMDASWVKKENAVELAPTVEPELERAQDAMRRHSPAAPPAPPAVPEEDWDALFGEES